MCPGSALQLHPDVTMVVDAGAGSALALAEHYREAEAIRAMRERG